MTRISQYCNLNKILLLALGFWPYKQSKLTRFHCNIFRVILSTGIVFQITPLITLKCTSELVIKVLSSVSLCTMFLIQYHSYYLNIEVVKNLLIQLEHIHNKLKDKNEIAIVYKYSCIGKRYTIALTAIGFCGILVLSTSQIWLNLNDTNLSIMNVSGPHYFFVMEYFIDQKKYFYLILLHACAVLYIGGTVLLAIGTILITYIEHTCGMFKIASYRIEHAVNMDLQNTTLKSKILMTEGIICAVHIHRQAIKLSKRILSTFEAMISCFTGCVVICFSLNLFQLFQITSFKNNVHEFILHFTYATISILHMFIANYIGQSVIDHNNHVYIAAYNVQWYRTPLHIQRMVLFLLQRGAIQHTLNIGGLFDASIEGFATLIRASISYFTLINSVQ
ncbi:uncharacterized protein LOC113004038 isoform X2 [Solenopsis invicta]|uniref:uncharacterized protein LOC113004038 isoform X2 n=1 Tax=Solenopsis invicta TaxID=13686 RepID=UPI00193DBD72|nr:uncharacterized protein LOC113004038 isoform X2 [Solenopsis invicta]